MIFSSYQVCYARILDLKRKFLEAALRYYDISQIEKRQIGDEYAQWTVSFFFCDIFEDYCDVMIRLNCFVLFYGWKLSAFSHLFPQYITYIVHMYIYAVVWQALRTPMFLDVMYSKPVSDRIFDTFFLSFLLLKAQAWKI